MGLNSTMANREVCNLIFCNYKDKKPFLNLDYANVSTTELTGESLFAYGGKGHPKRVQFAGEKGGTLTIETQMQSAKLWQLITGGEATNKASYVVREELTTKDKTTIELSAAPMPGSVNVYAMDDDCGTALEANASGSTVTLATALTEDTTVIVYYIKEVSGSDKVQNISIKADTFPKNFIVYGDTIMKTESGEILPYHMVAYKVAPQSTMSLSFTNNGDPGAITITCDLMADEENRFLDLILEEEAPDNGTTSN